MPVRILQRLFWSGTAFCRSRTESFLWLLPQGLKTLRFILDSVAYLHTLCMLTRNSRSRARGCQSTWLPSESSWYRETRRILLINPDSRQLYNAIFSRTRHNVESRCSDHSSSGSSSKAVCRTTTIEMGQITWLWLAPPPLASVTTYESSSSHIPVWNWSASIGIRQPAPVCIPNSYWW